MFGKFAVFFVVALCATQALSVQPEPRAIEDIINSIKEIVKKIEGAIADIVGNIPALIKNLKDKIQDIVDKIDIGGIIGQIQAKIDAIIAQAGVDIAAAKKCIDAEKSEVSQMIQEAQDSIAKCKKTAEDRTEELAHETEELKTRALALVEEVKSGVQQCIHDHGLNPIKLAKCMGDHLADIKSKADALVKQVFDTIATAAKTAGDITATLAKCTAQITTDLIAKEKQIIQNFQKCVDEVKEQQ